MWGPWGSLLMLKMLKLWVKKEFCTTKEAFLLSWSPRNVIFEKRVDLVTWWPGGGIILGNKQARWAGSGLWVHHLGTVSRQGKSNPSTDWKEMVSTEESSLQAALCLVCVLRSSVWGGANRSQAWVNSTCEAPWLGAPLITLHIMWIESESELSTNCSVRNTLIS